MTTPRRQGPACNRGLGIEDLRIWPHRLRIYGWWAGQEGDFVSESTRCVWVGLTWWQRIITFFFLSGCSILKREANPLKRRIRRLLVKKTRRFGVRSAQRACKTRKQITPGYNTEYCTTNRKKTCKRQKQIPRTQNRFVSLQKRIQHTNKNTVRERKCEEEKGRPITQT